MRDETSCRRPRLAMISSRVSSGSAEGDHCSPRREVAPRHGVSLTRIVRSIDMAHAQSRSVRLFCRS